MMTWVFSVQNLLMPSNMRPGLDRCSIMSPAITTSNFRSICSSSSRSTSPATILVNTPSFLVFVDDLNAAIDTDGLRPLGEFPMQALLCGSDSVAGGEIGEAHTTQVQHTATGGKPSNELFFSDVHPR